LTEISDLEAASALWAGGEPGKEAVRAAWDEARKLDHCTQRTPASPPWSGTSTDQVSLEIGDVSVIVYAAAIAAGWDAEPMEDEAAPAHDHRWAILGVQPHTPTVLFGKPVPHTIVLIRCTECGEPDARMLPGEWTLGDLQATGEQQR